MNKKNKKVEYKFTKDGKKVGVLEQVNENEVIVQEVFVNENGVEFLGGKKFVVDELFDYFPAVSWEQRRLNEIQESFDREKKLLEKDIQDSKRELLKLQSSLRARVQWMRDVAKQPFEDEIKKVISRLCDFYECKDMWAGYIDCGRPYIFPFKFDEVNKHIDRFEGASYDIPRFDGMRLVSLYGKSDGRFEFRIDSYGYGTNNITDREKKYFFFSSQEEATQFVQDWVDKKEEYYSSAFEVARDFGVKLDKEKVREYYSSSIKSEKRYEETKRKELSNSRKRLKNYDAECERIIKELCK